MPDFDDMPDLQFIFGALLLIANRIDTLLERELSAFNVTAKQWFISVIIYSLFDRPPTISEVARVMGSTHQNVKQIALKLAEKNLLTLEKDEKDRRATRLVPTDYSAEFWAATDTAGASFIGKLFTGLSENDLAAARMALLKLWQNLDSMQEA
jgi:DNA-binding MarR family transcriptional regulator